MIENPETNAGKIFALGIQSLIFISIVSFSFDTLPDITVKEKKILHYIEIFTVVVFTFEYSLRIIIAKNKARFLFSFYGMVDLLAILPFYISSGVDLRAIRIFRFFRLFRILKLLRYNRALTRMYRAFMIAREELVLFSFLTIIVLYLSAVGIYYFENQAQPDAFKSVFHSLWWAVATLTTVGYGDIYPVTTGGRIFTFVVLMLGLGIVAIPAGLIASAFSQARNEEED